MLNLPGGRDDRRPGVTLRRARFCPYCGRRLKREALGGRVVPAPELKPACAECGYVHLDAPAPVAGIIVWRGDEVLLARPHGWSEFALVTGFLEPYETIEAAAVRELREENGLGVAAVGVLGTYS